MSYKLNTRMDQDLNDFEKGLNFGSPSGELHQLEGLNVLNVAVDTIKQFYNGTIPHNIIQSLDRLSDDGGEFYEKANINKENHLYLRSFELPFDATISRMGKFSGYQYKIQNNDLGVIILLKSFHKPFNEAASHMKIELSPHMLAANTPASAQKIMDSIASLYLEDSKPCGVAPHLCVDLQGWDMPKHMEDDIVTRSRALTTYNGIDNVQFDIDLDSVLVSYGRQQSIRVGSAKGLQTVIYRKDLEIIKSDKVDFFHELWDERSLGSFNKELPVWRFEERFHHSIIKDFERGIGEDINSYLEISNYLNDLWLYALDTNRYQFNNTIAPIWQFLMEDITFNDSHLTENFKRKYKKKNDVTAVTRCVSTFLRNFMIMKARHKVDFRLVKMELESMSVFEEILLLIVSKKQDLGPFWDEYKQKYLLLCTCSKFS